MRYTFIKNGIVTDNGTIESSQIEWFVSSVVSPSDHVVLTGGSGELTGLFSSRGDVPVSELFRLGNTLMQKDYVSNDSCIDGLAALFRLRGETTGRSHDTGGQDFYGTSAQELGQGIRSSA